MNLYLKSLDEVEVLEQSIFAEAQIELLQLSIDLLQRANLKMLLIPEGRGVGRILNLLQWEAGAPLEYVDGDGPFADQVIHFAVHQVLERKLGSQNPYHMLFAETLASASDLYLLGKLIGAGEECDFLLDTLESLGSYYQQYGEEEELEVLLTNLQQKPFEAMVALSSFFYETCAPLLYIQDPHAIVERLLEAQNHNFYPLLHHYNLTNWILNIRARHPIPPLVQPSLDELSKGFFTSENHFLDHFRHET